MKIKSSIAKDLQEGWGEVENWRWYEEEEGDSGRWSTWMTTILKETNSGTYWAYNWDRGLTENQENTYPWDYGDEEIDLFAVEKVYTIGHEWKKAE